MYATCFGLSLGHHQSCQYKNLIKEDVVKYNLLTFRNLASYIQDGRKITL